ncbi:MAG TPA: protein kinase [Gemmatimonadaceae bacterium]|nr:protein kinase [Gemmatimonadaceae bacterium]
MTRCPTCGASYAADAKFCTKDGTRLVAATAGAPAAPSPTPPGNPMMVSGPRSTTAAGRGEPKPTQAHASLVGQVLDKRYKIERKLGEGGMSFVYLATDISTQQQFAIKVLSEALSQDTNAMARLRREAALGMRLAHPNVCHIMRLGETEDGLVYVVMPYVNGEILADRNNRLGRLSLPDTVKFVKDIAAGLQVAHELKIVHRDLKPENIMICRGPNATEYAVVMDFGLAKERKAEGELQKLTATGIILGTPEFMSPEQLRGKPLDPRTDIYSLALMTYEMLTGKLPFQGRTQQEMMIARLRSDPIPIRRMRPDFDIPEAVEKSLNKAMARNPDDRYQTVVEFGEALGAAAGGVSAESGLLGKLFGR